MTKPNKTPKGSENTENATAADVSQASAAQVAGTQPQDVSVPIAGDTPAAAADGTAAPTPAKPSGIPEHLKKGNRVCASCLTPEADFLKKNQRYSLCQGVDVLCYRKGDRVIHDVTLEQVNAKYPDKVGKTDDKGRLLISEVGGIGIKPGILVRGAVSYKRQATDTATGQAPAGGQASGEAAGQTGTTTAS
jgi:hypothetical protein